ncbi:glyoxalase [Phyllobacterium salinisoli]|uniref:Glyoxalase n=1 Tax=Phyllobacterium salinisoli TaxID=1899321 RepID=A0A368K3D9_9HYPH|nr:VOC family protein [Phyllobacterium salinisoli]RCS23897.1 glyoxalase [Phyllobacterium salinisoli]
MSLFDHIGFHTADLNRSLHFYAGCMPALELEVIRNADASFFVSGGERAPVPFIWITAVSVSGPAAVASPAPPENPGNHLHLMFAALSRDAVEAFHQAALAFGGVDSGSPGYQGPEEMGYYAALVFDPDGNTIEVGFRERRS